MHWVTGRDKPTVDKVPVEQLIAPAVLDRPHRRGRKNPDYLLEIEDVKAWEQEHGALPRVAGCSSGPGGNGARATRTRSFTCTRAGRTRLGVSVACAKWLAEECAIIGLGVETVGTDAGLAGGFDSVPLPHVHAWRRQAGFDVAGEPAAAPETGILLVAAPLPIVGGWGAGPGPWRSSRAEALMQVTEAIARTLVELGVRQVFGLIGSGNYQLTEALQEAGASFTRPVTRAGRSR